MAGPQTAAVPLAVIQRWLDHQIAVGLGPDGGAPAEHANPQDGTLVGPLFFIKG